MMAVLTPWPHLTQYRGPQLCTSMSGALWVLLEPLFLHIWCVGPWVMSHITQCWHRLSPLTGTAAASCLLWERLLIQVAVPKILETAALQHFWCPAP